MTDSHTLTATLAQLRAPFPRNQIGKIPAGAGRPALDFVGHAAVTDRLNSFAPEWTYTIDERFEHGATCWVKGTLTILGITRVEYGDGKDPKEAIGNFIRRAAMRFGVAIDLWSREELIPSDSGTTSHPRVAQTDRAPVPTTPKHSPSVPESGTSPPAEANRSSRPDSPSTPADPSPSAVIGSADGAGPGSGVAEAREFGEGSTATAPPDPAPKSKCLHLKGSKPRKMSSGRMREVCLECGAVLEQAAS